MTENDRPAVEENGPAQSDLELRGQEGGIWRLVTQGSSHIVDLNNGTIKRVPGPSSRPSINDVERPLIALASCRVGSRGSWRMFSDRPDVAWYWHDSSVIRRVDRLPLSPSESSAGASHAELASDAGLADG